MRKSAKIAFLSFIISFNVYGQTAAPEYMRPSEYVFLGQFDELLATVADTINEGSNSQILGNYNTFLGRGDLNAELKGLPSGKACTSDGVRELSGSAWMLDHAKDAKLIMFNENHLTLASRTFLLTHLNDLKALGFTHIGFEALLPSDDEKSIKRILAIGYYTIEPMFSALIRNTAELGFTIFGYENVERPNPLASREEQINVREKGQTHNILKVLNSSSPDSKFIIYAGWSHIAEEPLPSSIPNHELRWMASLLKEQSGINPLTIDLTQCFYTSSNSEGWKGRIYISDSGSPLIQSTYLGAVDAQIYLPVPAVQAADAANYYRKALGRPYQIPEHMRSGVFPVLVQARSAGVNKASVAYDRVLLRPGEDLPLYLKNGDYEITSYKGDGSIIGEQVVQIKEVS